MKVATVKPPVQFEPITLTIESARELAALKTLTDNPLKVVRSFRATGLEPTRASQVQSFLLDLRTELNKL